jgi:hypothetical protein
MNHLHLLKTAIFASALLPPAIAHAQMDSCNVFMQGRYVELGMAPNGTFGSSVTEPAGYHGNFVAQGAIQFPCNYSDGGTVRLAFVADPAMDGWNTGSPAYYGDYILPGYLLGGSFYAGAPYEGWILTVEDSAWLNETNNQSSMGAGTPAGTYLSYNTVAGKLVSTYTQTFDSVTVKQVTSLDTAGLYLSMQITLTNISSTPRNNIYYTRIMAAHPDEVQSGDFDSKSTIVHNYPADPTRLVTSTGTTDTAAYVALGTADTNSRAFISSIWPLPMIFSQPWNGDNTTNTAALYNGDDSLIAPWYSGTDTGDNAIGLIFSIPHLAPADSVSDSTVHKTTGLEPANSKTFSLFYSFSSSASAAALGSGNTTGVININASNIKVYPIPASTVLNVSGLLKTDRVTIFDVMGRAVNGDWTVHNDGINTFAVNDLQTGNYILVVSDASGNIKSRTLILKY